MTTTAPPRFDTGALRAAIEGRDADAQIALHTPDAEVVLVDSGHGPSRPLVLTGDALAAQLRDVCARDMSHRVSATALDGDTLAYEVECTYPDGTRVLCQAIATLRDGRIARSRGVQAWDA